MFNKEEFFNAVSMVTKKNLISEKEVFKLLEDVVINSFHSKYDPDADLDFKIDPDKKIFELVNNSTLVVGDEEEPILDLEIKLSDAKKIQKDAKVGDLISNKIDLLKFKRQIEQLLRQRLSEKRKENIYEQFKHLEGQEVKAKVLDINKGALRLELVGEGIDAHMPANLRNTRIPLAIDDVIDVFVEEIQRDARSRQVVVSNGSSRLLKKIIDSEIPEVEQGIIEVIEIARIPGFRSKVAVSSTSEDIDATGTLIGPGGSRINAVVDRIYGEKIDVVKYDSDVAKFICNALQPAKVISVVNKIDAQGQIVVGAKLVITPDEHQTLAIGKNGNHIRLVVELTGFRLDVISYSTALEREMEIEWNGSLTPEEHEEIKSGRFDNRKRREGGKQGFSNNYRIPSELDQELTSELSSFNEELYEGDGDLGIDFSFSNDLDNAKDELFDMKNLSDSTDISDDELDALTSEFDF